MHSRLLIIGHTFPEPTTTAAGGRMMQLINLFMEGSYSVHFATTATHSEFSENLETYNVQVAQIHLNHSSFDHFIKELDPHIVLFDRFITEEQFGWRVIEQCPNAIRILDTEDLHFLRKARELAVKKNDPLHLFTDDAKRELASILRCDLTLLISEDEMHLLLHRFHIPDQLLCYLPLLVDDIPIQLPDFEHRRNFISIGNFQHAPNLDAVKFMKKSLWTEIRKQLPEAELHIYGAYSSKEVSEWHNVKEGFLVKGWAANLEEVMSHSRVCIAPLRFGAGLKGKLLDASKYGTPSVTTKIGAEGLCGEFPFGGLIGDSMEEIISASVRLYSNQSLWNASQKNGFRLIENRFLKEQFALSFLKLIAQIKASIAERRQENFIGQILHHQSFQATKYLSKWIEEKNQKKNDK